MSELGKTLSFKEFLDLISSKGYTEKAVEFEEKAVKQLGSILGRDYVLGMTYNEVLLALNLTKFVPKRPRQTDPWFIPRARQLQSQGFNVYINKDKLKDYE